VDASIAQFGRLPGDAQSLQLKVHGQAQYFSVTFGGQNIQMLPFDVKTNYTLYGGDISLFAGQVGELRLTALTTPLLPHNFLTFDSIVFSSQPVPEPPSIVLLSIGVAVSLGWWRLRRRRK
jgi:hypothetical protein